MPSVVLPFEKPIVELLTRIEEVRQLAEADDSFAEELALLREQTAQVSRQLFAQLTPIQKVQLSRHASRPYTLDYVEHMFDGWVELAGDRRFGNDASIVSGLARFKAPPPPYGSGKERSVVIVGHQKGRGTKENVQRNFGMPNPEGYRKAIRMFELAGRFGLPILTFIDTPGAYPGLGAEERGQSEAIGASLAAMARAPVPIIASVIGEGGSGGALALGVANRVLVLEFGCYSVISPEGCAAILWKDGALANEAAKQLKITAPDLLNFGVVDRVVEEPPGGAHQDHEAAALMLAQAIDRELEQLAELNGEGLIDQRYQRFRKLGEFSVGATPAPGPRA